MHKPVIFLDFDGVLNTPKTWGKWPIEQRVDKDKIERLVRLVNGIDAEVVISSSWRRHYSLAELRTLLHKVGGLNQDRVIGVTGGRDDHDRRGHEIWDWLVEHKREKGPFVVLDDMDPECFTKVADHFVQTLGRVGLTDENVKEAAEILLEV